MEQDRVISALNNAVSNAESISPQNSVKDVSPTKLKEALAEKQTQIWELEEGEYLPNLEICQFVLLCQLVWRLSDQRWAELFSLRPAGKSVSG